jgi:hypothetical protein
MVPQEFARLQDATASAHAAATADAHVAASPPAVRTKRRVALVHVAPVPSHISKQVALVAVTADGARIHIAVKRKARSMSVCRVQSCDVGCEQACGDPASSERGVGKVAAACIGASTVIMVATASGGVHKAWAIFPDPSGAPWHAALDLPGSFLDRQLP